MLQVEILSRPAPSAGGDDLLVVTAFMFVVIPFLQSRFATASIRSLRTLPFQDHGHGRWLTLIIEVEP